MTTTERVKKLIKKYPLSSRFKLCQMSKGLTMGQISYGCDVLINRGEAHRFRGLGRQGGWGYVLVDDKKSINAYYKSQRELMDRVIQILSRQNGLLGRILKLRLRTNRERTYSVLCDLADEGRITDDLKLFDNDLNGFTNSSRFEWENIKLEPLPKTMGICSRSFKL